MCVANIESLALGLVARPAKRYKVTTDSIHSLPVAANLLMRDISTTAPNQKWVSDITYVRTTVGWLYLAVIIDLYSRKVIGWSMRKRMTKQLVCDGFVATQVSA